MGQVSEQDLQAKTNNQYVLAIEVTNGLKRGNFGYKVEEAEKNKQFLERTSPTATVETAIIFTKNEHAITNRKFSLDFLLQLKELQQDKSIQALALALARPEQYNPEQNERIIRFFIEQLKHGRQMQELFYPTEEQLRILAQDAPFKLPRDAHTYAGIIADVKGITLEEYTGILLRQLFPDMPIISGHTFKRKGKIQDIDHLVIGDRTRIRPALANGRTFYAHNTRPKEKEKYVRANYGAQFR